MSTISKSTREARTREFISVTGVSSTEASRYLKSSNWRLEAALDAFFNSNHDQGGGGPLTNHNKGGASSAALTRNLEALWNRFCDDNDREEIGLQGTMEYCDAIAVDPERLEFLALASATNAPTMGKFRKREWVDAWTRFGCDSVDSQRAYVAEVLKPQLATDDQVFKRVYQFSFDYAKPEGQKSMPFEIAQELWNLLIPLDPANSSRKTTTMTTSNNGSRSGVANGIGGSDEGSGGRGGFDRERLQWWIEFLIEAGSKVVSKDTWSLFLEFTRTIDRDFETYDEEAAWPSLIDDFVLHVRESRLSNK